MSGCPPEHASCPDAGAGATCCGIGADAVCCPGGETCCPAGTECGDDIGGRAVCRSRAKGEEEPEPLIEVISSFSSHWHRRRPSPRHVLPTTMTPETTEAVSTVTAEEAWAAAAAHNGLARGAPKEEDECNGDQNYCSEGDYCCPSDMSCCFVPSTGFKGCCEDGPDVSSYSNERN